MSELITIKQAVAEVLEECQNARNSDKLLIMLAFRKLGYNIWIEDINGSPSFESIRRWRQKFQQEGLYPSNKKVSEMRSINEKEYKEVFINA